MTGDTVKRLFAGDDWAQDHHDVEVMDETGKVLARRRLPEGVEGMARFHGLAGGLLGDDDGEAEVVAGIETDHGPWVTALIAAGYRVLPVNPQQPARFRARHAVSGAKSDAGGAHVLADMVRTGSHQLREAAGDSPEAEGIKVLARTHKTLIWERTRQVQRLRHQLLEYFPAALDAFGQDLDASDALELLGKAPDPEQARRLTRAQLSAAMKRARRRNIPDRATAVLAALRCPSPGWDPSSAPGCSQSPATTPAATPAARPAATTPAPAPSPAPLARGKSSRHGSSATAGSPAPSTPRPRAP